MLKKNAVDPVKRSLSGKRTVVSWSFVDEKTLYKMTVSERKSCLWHGLASTPVFSFFLEQDHRQAFLDFVKHIRPELEVNPFSVFF